MFEPSQKPLEQPLLQADGTPVILELLAQSRTRCEETYRLDRTRRAGPDLLTPGELKTVAEPLELLKRIARPEMEALLEKLALANYVVVLSDANGVAIDFVSSGEPDRKLWRMGVCAGATWGEPHVGTNGIGTSIMSRTPIIVHQRHHFLLKYAELTCTAAPLFDAQGRVIASLDASSVANLPEEIQGLVLDLVVKTARRIERLYFLERYRDHTIMTIDCRESMVQGNSVLMLAVGDDGCVIDIRGNAVDGAGAAACASYRHMNMANVLENAWRTPAIPAGATHVEYKTVVNLEGIMPCFAVLRTPSRKMPQCVALVPSAKQKPRLKALGPKPVLNLQRLAGSHPALRAYVSKIGRFAAFRLPFLIQGETGTGKEEFARAIHAYGPRSAGPFVAIDCSSIPENLIESELFGYEGGTFTGGRREGRRGRILDANGGTLLLDEIGDMPLHLQTRLLRVLAQNEITPLGSHNSIRVDFNLICATHQDLRALIAQKRFREDLYFRIAGCRIELPPLRAREDKDAIILGALEIECDLAEMSDIPNIAAPALEVLRTHRWPGNMRQLRLALRYALASSAGAQIELADIPSELLELAEEHEEHPRVTSGMPPGDNVEEALRRNEWSVSKTAREFGVTRQTVHRWMNTHNLKRP